MNSADRLAVRATCVSLLLLWLALMGAVAFGQSVGNVGRIGVLMGPVGDGGEAASGLPVGALVTESNQGLVTESGQFLVVE